MSKNVLTKNKTLKNKMVAVQIAKFYFQASKLKYEDGLGLV